MRLPTALVAALSLVLGFAVAQATDLRWAGGAVVLAGAGWCVARERRRTAWWRLVLVLLVGAAAFLVSHLLADSLGAWGAVLVAAAVLGVATHLLVGRAAPRAPDTPNAPAGPTTQPSTRPSTTAPRS